ncbi:hypothetical protein TSUD_125730 [Trifolium subterraneum]|uniref:Uncharacterized protein n=1 Tax=Trifolium subterraneum TaxID=3900 RepID=A0A2Z6MQ32_TRISU|nr:hypothetical protein TSUD_125730 [Trifolium subterraneum]
MASLLTDLVKPHVEKLINGAITESSYICCFTCIAKDFEEEKARLEPEWTTFKQRVDVAKRKGEDVQDNALSWEEEAEKLIQEDTKTKEKCFFGLCCHCIWRYRRGKELANKKEQIKKLMETGKELAIGLPVRLPDVERYSSQYYIPFKSRESKYKELLDALNDEKNYIVGLQGMGGTGKTTLIRELGKELKQSKQFTQVVDTTVSFSPDIKKIQDDIAGPLGLKFDDCNESDRSKKLWSRLTKGEKILIILDDVWGDIDFDEIGIPHIDNHKGCRVFVTTRNMWVCNRLGCSKTIQLDLLSEEDAWIMFQSHAGLTKVSTKNLLDKGRKIAKECKSLPIAIAAIASSLKGEQRREEWDVALNSLKHISMRLRGVDKDLVDVYKCLKFSYDYLKDRNAEELFLLCSVFQEDEEITIKILTRLSIGVGLFGEGYDKYNNARNLLIVAKNKLLDSCLLLKTDEGDVKMHDLVREVAQWIASEEILVVNFSNKNQKSVVGRSNIKYLLFDGTPNDLCSPRFDGSKLKILILIMGTCCFGDSFFENIAGLRVLNLIADYQTIPLPQSIRLLTNIRSLLVESADLGDISVLGSLQSLETLDLNLCTIEELPQEIAKLKELRLLNFDDCTIESNNPFEVIQRCPSLEELYFEDSFNDFCQEITLPTLERYHLTQGYSKFYDSSLSKSVSLENDYLSEATFKYVMQTAEHLKLERIKKGWRNIMPEIVPIDEGMNDLIELHLKDDSQLRCLVDTEHIGCSQLPNVFSKLVVLKLFKMNNLEELCNGPISFDSMNSLEKLTIMSCGNLRSLFKGNLNLCNLKTVKIEECSKLVSVFHLSPSGSLPLLEVLNISGCHQLVNIFTNEKGVDDPIEEILLPKLKVVKIEECNELTYIFDQEVKLDSLIQLELEDVSNFIDIFPKSCDSNSKEETQLQLQEVEPMKSNILSCCYGYKSKGSTTNTKVPTETSSYCLNIWERAQCLSRLSHIICNIKVITLISVPNIKSVFVLSIAPKMLLKSLTITGCDELEHIVVDIGDGSGGNELGINVFPKLKELYVGSCKKLKYIFGHINASNDNDQNNNEIQLHLPALKSLKLSSLPSLIGICPKQYHTTFSPLKVLEFHNCSQDDVKSIGDFTFLTSISRYQDNTTVKQFSGNIEHFLALESLKVSQSNVETILCLNEKSEPEIDLGLQDIILRKLPMMIYPFVGPKNAFALKHLKSIVISQCEKLEIVFSTSVLRCLSQLTHIRIHDCNELKHIIEEEDDDIENAMSSKTCFPVLKNLIVSNCNKLKSVFPVSMSKELPELKAMLIWDAYELVEIFKSVGDDDHKVEIPNLKVVAFVNLPNLCHLQGIQGVRNHLVQNCKKLSLTSSGDFGSDVYDTDVIEADVLQLLTCLKYRMTSSQGIQVSVEEGTASTSYANTITSSTHLESLEGSTSEQTEAATMFTTSELKNEADGIKISVEDDTTSANAMTVTSSTDHSKSVSSSSLGVEGVAKLTNAMTITSSTHSELEQNVDVKDFQETSKTNNDQVSPNDDAFMNVSSIIEEQFSKDDPSPSNSLPLPFSFQTHSMPFEGNPSQKVEDLSPTSMSIAITEPLSTKDSDVKVFLNDGAVVIEEQFPKDNVFRVLESKPSSNNNLPLHLEFETPIPTEAPE